MENVKNFKTESNLRKNVFNIIILYYIKQNYEDLGV
jgi:hypothetical protein